MLTHLVASPNSSYQVIMQLHSSILVKTALFSYYQNVQCLLHKDFFVLASKVYNPSIIPLIRVVVLPDMLSNGRVLQLPFTAGIFVFP